MDALCMLTDPIVNIGTYIYISVPTIDGKVKLGKKNKLCHVPASLLSLKGQNKT